MKIQYSIIVTFQREGWHRWPGASGEYAYLAEPHRHMFHFKVFVELDHSARQVEMIKLKQILYDWSESILPRYQCVVWSCEKMAEMLLSHWRSDYNVTRVEVWEDGENAGVAEVING